MLHAIVEIAGDQPARATNDKAVVRKSTRHGNTILVLCPPITHEADGYMPVRINTLDGVFNCTIEWLSKSLIPRTPEDHGYPDQADGGSYSVI